MINTRRRLSVFESKDKHSLKLATGIFFIALIYLFAGLWFRPIVSGDALNGMVSLLNHLNGSAWNVSYSLSPDRGQVISHPLTWWAPGQYELPYRVASLLSVNIGTAIVVLLFGSVVGGCCFYLKVFQFSEISTNTVLFALLVLLLQRFININFIQYSSPDLFLFFFTPFYIFIYFWLASGTSVNTLLIWIILTALNLAGLFIKNSFLLFEISFNAFLVVEYAVHLFSGLTGPGSGSRKLYTLVLLVLPFAAANLLFYLFFLRMGVNPSQGEGWQLSIVTLLTGIFTPVAEVLFASLSSSGIYGNVYDKINLSAVAANLLMLFFLAGAGCFFYANRTRFFNKFKRDRVFRFVTVIACAYLLFWLFFTLHQSAVSSEDRLFLPVTIFVFPYLLDYSVKSVQKYRYIYFAMVAGSLFYGVFTFVCRIKDYSLHSALSSTSQELNGFKVLSGQHNQQPYLRQISAMVSSDFKGSYLIISRPELAFELNVSNKFMVMPVPPGGDPLYSGRRPDCLILAERGKDVLPAGLKYVYAAGNFFLYRISPPGLGESKGRK